MRTFFRAKNLAQKGIRRSLFDIFYTNHFFINFFINFLTSVGTKRLFFYRAKHLFAICSTYHPVPSTRYLVAGTQYSVPGIQQPVPSSGYFFTPKETTQYPVPRRGMRQYLFGVLGSLFWGKGVRGISFRVVFFAVQRKK